MLAINPDYQTPARMAQKREAIPLPDLAGKSVLDVGCDMAHWSFFAAEMGASYVVGLDRNRVVRDQGLVDLVAFNTERARERGLGSVIFRNMDVGRQWREHGLFDCVLLFSLYHHIFINCGSHESIWFWLRRHVRRDGVLLWENPTSCADRVVRMHMSESYQARYTKQDIRVAAEQYFDVEEIGSAIHEPTREVWRCTPKRLRSTQVDGLAIDGVGGATAAFLKDNERRIRELREITGWSMFPGSLNVEISEPLAPLGFYRCQVTDYVDRRHAAISAMKLRWLNLTPAAVNGERAFAFRFENEAYPETLLEFVSASRLRDKIDNNKVHICL